MDEAFGIIIADDSPIARLVVSRWLSHCAPKAHVFEAGNGIEVLELIAAHTVDLLLLDINMPVLDGLECLNLLRNDPAHKDLEVLAVSAVREESRITEAIAAGVSDYLLKPMDFRTFEARLQRAFQRALEKRAERNRERSLAQPRVLIADPDPNFCALAQSALAGRFDCEVVRTAGEALLKIMRWQPDLALLSPQISGFSLNMILGKARALRQSHPVKTYLFVDGENTPADAQLADGTLRHTFVPEAFRAQVASLLCGESGWANRGIAAWVHALEPEILTALRQTLGVMTGQESEEVKEPPEAEPFELYARIEQKSDSEGFTLILTVEYGRNFALALGVAMIGLEPSDVDEEMQNSSIGEILNVVAGRIKNSCGERKIVTELGLPTVTAGPCQQPQDCDYSWLRRFRWRGHNFQLVLSAVSRAPAADVPQPAAEDHADCVN